jgi:hypothetical protein
LRLDSSQTTAVGAVPFEEVASGQMITFGSRSEPTSSFALRHSV